MIYDLTVLWESRTLIKHMTLVSTISFGILDSCGNLNLNGHRFCVNLKDSSIVVGEFELTCVILYLKHLKFAVA